ncbi:MAG: EamA family transporter [Gammaproteobacteria bacterium]|nr:MAG: EamA family transporter [Gammaproteobacteria bacterium]
MPPLLIILYFLFLAATWGASFLFLRLGVPEFGPYAFSGFRVTVAGLILLPLVINKRCWQEIKIHWGKLALIGTVNMGIPFTLYSYAAQQLSAGILSVINATAPILTGVIAHLFFSDYLSKRQLIGLVIGLCGVSLLMSDQLQADIGSLAPLIAALMACCCYAISANLTKRHLSRISPVTIATIGLLASGLFTLPFSITHLPQQTISPSAWAAAFGIAILSTSIAMIMFYHIIKTVGPTKTVSITLLVPVFGILWGMLLLDETLTVNMVIGTVVILSGTALSILKPSHKSVKE